MARKVFVSYKFKDDSVKNLHIFGESTVRDYVNILEEKLSKDNIYCGEHEDEDLSGYSDEYIWGRLKDKIYPTSVTIVLISPKMKENHRFDKSQWIPWEISYSLRETQRGDRTSHTNGVLAVVLPDKYGSYDYAYENYGYSFLSDYRLKKEKIFTIISENQNNVNDLGNFMSRLGKHIKSKSYITDVKWDVFIKSDESINKYIELAYEISKDKSLYEIHYQVNK